ncbi:CidA/LrgA family protein [Nitrogeniibacter mangrovi]|uniref:CidA/LrgA family protein n=1 Tax=Nitrogeniibacter mangrovi TaxID=2016596 RepID=A0A6C1B2X7_9RHOO|nr:CidA/LrgA family protein [Nitrogeniibacter mangrovi]QID17188.1 CidA/LrgA family protein [Nitrogeniibacter mangrovi]
MLNAMTVLLGFQLIGEIITRLAGWPIPGPVIGMALLFLVLVLRRGPGEELSRTSNGLLSHLSLLFVPAGTGIMLHADRLASEWLPLAAALLASTLLTLGVSAVCLHLLVRKGQQRQ